jgi:predicted CXXCH cytochrome family protein
MCKQRFVVGLLLGALVLVAATVISDEPPARIHPAAWGDDHVGNSFPEYVTGDECLFCHRQAGPAWSENRHQLTIRPADDDEPAVRALREAGLAGVVGVQYLLGSRRITHFLRRSKEYGRLQRLSSSFLPEQPAAGAKALEVGGRLTDSKLMHWDSTTFGDRCAGCHTTAVTTATRSFVTLSLDCFACHGDVDLQHTKDVSLVLLSSRNRQSREVVSICGQCHLRGGKSRSSGLPYPNTFVAGDNLFRDFQVDFSDKAINALSPLDQHIFLNARDVVVLGKAAVSCLSCHDVHGQSSAKHRRLENADLCSSCHVPAGENSKLRGEVLKVNRLRSHNRVCEF